MKKVGEIEIKRDSGFTGQSMNWLKCKLLTKDNSIFLITYFSDREASENPRPGDRYNVNLIVITNYLITSQKWSDSDFKINFKMDENDIVIGKRKL